MASSAEAAFHAHVGGLEFTFKQIKHDLSCAANTLDVAFDEAESLSASGVPHPMKLLRRIERLEALAGTLQTDWRDIEERRNVIMPEVRSLEDSPEERSLVRVCVPLRFTTGLKRVAHFRCHPTHRSFVVSWRTQSARTALTLLPGAPSLITKR